MLHRLGLPYPFSFFLLSLHFSLSRLLHAPPFFVEHHPLSARFSSRLSLCLSLYFISFICYFLLLPSQLLVKSRLFPSFGIPDSLFARVVFTHPPLLFLHTCSRLPFGYLCLTAILHTITVSFDLSLSSSTNLSAPTVMPPFSPLRP